MSKPKTGGNGSGANGGADAPRVDGPALDVLGERLRQTYQEVVDEGIPPRFRDLLDQLRQSDGRTRKKDPT